MLVNCITAGFQVMLSTSQAQTFDAPSILMSTVNVVPIGLGLAPYDQFEALWVPPSTALIVPIPVVGVGLLICQSQVILEFCVMVKVTLVPLPAAGTSPVPVQPVQAYVIPVPVS